MVTKEKGKPRLPLWAQVILIIVCGAIASAAVFFIIRDAKTERFTVTFAYSDGTIIEQKKVKAGNGAVPPVLETEKVFRGWDKSINEITADLEVHPILYSIVEDNLFYFNSVYVVEGKSFRLDLTLGGNVNFSAGSLTMEYDPEVMEYKSSDCREGVSVTEEESGVLTVSFESETPITEKTLLAGLIFDSKKVDAYSSQVDLKAGKTTVVLEDGEHPADNATINNKVYFLQGVN